MDAQAWAAAWAQARAQIACKTHVYHFGAYTYIVAFAFAFASIYNNASLCVVIIIFGIVSIAHPYVVASFLLPFLAYRIEYGCRLTIVTIRNENQLVISLPYWSAAHTPACLCACVWWGCRDVYLNNVFVSFDINVCNLHREWENDFDSISFSLVASLSLSLGKLPVSTIRLGSIFYVVALQLQLHI